MSMPLYKVGRPVFRVKKSYCLIDQAVRAGGTIALIQRDRHCQDIIETAYAVVGTKEALILMSSVLNPLPAADQAGNFTIPMRHPEAWFSNIEKAHRIFNRLVRRGKIPGPNKVRFRRRSRLKRR